MCNNSRTFQVIDLCTVAEDALKISTATGIMLDPVYTLKGVRGMLSEIKGDPNRFKGHKILYIHTGRLTLVSLLLMILSGKFMCVFL